tara:strand:- start:2149 stop:2973 length:825 start_codon:yes stop_codon:yes gene_type:complete
MLYRPSIGDGRCCVTNGVLPLKYIVAAFCCLLVAVTNVQGETATLKMRFVFDGVPPPVKQINIVPALAPAGGPVLDERLIIDPVSKGIRNVVVYAHTDRGETKLGPFARSDNRHRLAMSNDRFDPHVLLAQAGDTIELVNRGRVQHNPVLSFFANQPRDVQIPPGVSRLIPVPRPEPAPIPVDCNRHPWMHAYVFVLDHPFVACSDSEGSISIAGLPANTRLTFRVFHEAGRINRVGILGEETEWPRSRFSVDLVEGVNDLGDILVPATSLKPN